MWTENSPDVRERHSYKSDSVTSGSSLPPKAWIGQDSTTGSDSSSVPHRRRSIRAAATALSRRAGHSSSSGGMPPRSDSSAVSWWSSRWSTAGIGAGRCGGAKEDTISARGDAEPDAARRHANRYASSAPKLWPKNACGPSSAGRSCSFDLVHQLSQRGESLAVEDLDRNYVDARAERPVPRIEHRPATAGMMEAEQPHGSRAFTRLP